MMSSRQSQTKYQIAAHKHDFNNISHKKNNNKSNNVSHSKSADIIVLNGDSLNGEKYRPRLPHSLRFGEYGVEQIPYIEGLGWMLIYLFRRYPELKETQGFEYAHIKGTEHSMRKGFYETHAFFTIDVGSKNLTNVQYQDESITIDVAYGRLEGEKSCWTVEVFSEGGLVRKFVCDTQEQVVLKLNQQFNKYGLLQVAWHQSQK